LYAIKGVGQLIAKIIDRSVDISSFLAGIILLAMASITTFEIIARYIFHSPTSWTLDLSVYLLVWFGYLSIVYVQKEDRHVRVDLLISRFSKRTRLIWDALTAIIFFFFTLLLVYYGTGYTVESYESHEYGWSMWRIILWPVKAAIPVGGILLALYLIKYVVEKWIRFRKEPKVEPRGVFDNLTVLIPTFLFLIAIGAYLYTLNGVFGMVVLMLVLLFGGVPIFPALGWVGITGYYLLFGGGNALYSSVPSVVHLSLEHFALVCLPLFVLVGQLIQSSGVSDEIYDTATKWVGHFPGGEAIATILACSIFAAISVSSVATAATIGLVALPALAARKYNKVFSYGLLAAGGTLGIMIPPSGTMIIYSAVTEESLGKLFMAGVVPGAILVCGFIIYAVYFCLRSGEYERLKPVTWGERFRATKAGMWGLLAPVIIMAGIYSGIFTPLESGAIAVFYAIIMVLARGKVKPKDLPKVLADSTLNSTMVLSIMIGAMLLGDFITLMKVPDMAMSVVESLRLSPWGVMVMVMLMYLGLGMFLEVISCMLITLPVIYPLITSLGFDGVWFAVLVTLNMEMALITPPVGLNLYVITGIASTPLANVLRGVFPFFLIMVAGLILIALFPALSTWLPGIMVRR
jgi:C4-dicarboxylate transporter DctM subunit